MFNRIVGVKDKTYEEGTHFMVPWFDRPIVFDVRTRPRQIQSLTGSKGACRRWHHCCRCRCRWHGFPRGCELAVVEGGAVCVTTCPARLHVAVCCLATSRVCGPCGSCVPLPPFSGADLQMVQITLRVLTRPNPDRLPVIYREIGIGAWAA
jgi:hypothetical protein